MAELRYPASTYLKLVAAVGFEPTANSTLLLALRSKRSSFNQTRTRDDKSGAPSRTRAELSGVQNQRIAIYA